MGPLRKRLVPWSLHEQHLDEAAFLWEQWELALEAANENLLEVAGGVEERLHAHLDALVLGGVPVAERMLRPALDGEPRLAAAAAWALLAAEDADHLDVVLAALASAEPPGARALARALALSVHPTVAVRLTALWGNAEPALRALLLPIMEVHDLAWASAQLPHTLGASEPEVLVPSLRILRRTAVGDPTALRQVEYALAHPSPAVRVEAMTTAAALGSRAVWDACHREAREPAGGSLPLALLTLSPRPADRSMLYERLNDPATRRHALWALGFLGDREAADAVAAFLGDDELGAMAGEAFTLITGLGVDGSFRRPGVTVGPETEEVGVDDPPPVVRPEDHLPAPAPAVIERWWRERRDHWKAGERRLFGHARTAETLRAALLEAPMWRRPILALELALETRAPLSVDLRGWAREQLRTLAPAQAPR